MSSMKPIYDDDLREAFWSRVKVSRAFKDCWPWLGAKKPKGYGNIRWEGENLTVHRVAFELCHGAIPDGFLVCHICDNPSCCNPNHMMLGTVKSNAADMVLKGRSKKPIYAARGQRNGNSKLNAEKVKEIRRLYKAKKLNQYELAERYGVSQPTIGGIVRNETWKDV